jgi:hypothetical protein
LLIIALLFGAIIIQGTGMKPAYLKATTLFSLILFIEFLFVLTDPLTDRWSGGNPLFKLGMNNR